MDFSVPPEFTEQMRRFDAFLREHLEPHLSEWYERKSVPTSFHRDMAEGRWTGFHLENGEITKGSALREALVVERLAQLSPGVAVATLAHTDLGLMGLWLFGSPALKAAYAESILKGETLVCLGNTETLAGSDVAGISARALETGGGWRIEGTKAYVTNGAVSDLSLITAVSDPEAARNRRLSMYLVDLHAEGVRRKKLNKDVWIPSDLTRIQLSGVFVPRDHLVGERGRGLQQVLSIFTHSRVPISALTLGTAQGAFEMALRHAARRSAFGKRIISFQAKAFEAADFYARIEAARLMLWKACWAMDTGQEFRLESSLAKYLSVGLAREVSVWAADLFGAASVISDHPVHKFPMDAWAASLGEGTQDVQKLVILRELVKRILKSPPPF